MLGVGVSAECTGEDELVELLTVSATMDSELLIVEGVVNSFSFVFSENKLSILRRAFENGK